MPSGSLRCQKGPLCISKVSSIQVCHPANSPSTPLRSGERVSVLAVCCKNVRLLLTLAPSRPQSLQASCGVKSSLRMRSVSSQQGRRLVAFPMPRRLLREDRLPITGISHHGKLPRSRDCLFIRKFVHHLFGCLIRYLNDFVDLSFGYDERRCKAKNVAMRHRSCNKPPITSRL